MPPEPPSIAGDSADRGVKEVTEAVPVFEAEDPMPEGWGPTPAVEDPGPEVADPVAAVAGTADAGSTF
jgi:hypothetical protein